MLSIINRASSSDSHVHLASLVKRSEDSGLVQDCCHGERVVSWSDRHIWDGGDANYASFFGGEGECYVALVFVRFIFHENRW